MSFYPRVPFSLHICVFHSNHSNLSTSAECFYKPPTQSHQNVTKKRNIQTTPLNLGLQIPRKECINIVWIIIKDCLLTCFVKWILYKYMWQSYDVTLNCYPRQSNKCRTTWSMRGESSLDCWKEAVVGVLVLIQFPCLAQRRAHPSERRWLIALRAVNWDICMTSGIFELCREVWKWHCNTELFVCFCFSHIFCD